MRFTTACLVTVFLGLTVPTLANEPDQPVTKPGGPESMKRFSYEPSIRMVQVMALTHAGLERRFMRNMQRRVRRAAWLPEVGLRVSGGRDIRSRDVVSLELVDSTGDTSLTETRTREVQVEASMKFQLSGLIYDPEEIDIARENRYSSHSRLTLLKRVTDVYFARRRAQLELVEVIQPERSKRWLRKLKIEQLTAELDGMTGGRFSRQMNGVSE